MAKRAMLNMKQENNKESYIIYFIDGPYSGSHTAITEKVNYLELEMESISIIYDLQFIGSYSAFGYLRKNINN